VTPTRPLTVREAADRLGISRSKAYDLIAAGEVPHYRIGRRVLVDPADVEAFRARCRGEGPRDRPAAGPDAGAWARHFR
jgi:excisionase family DNA binding protein